MMFSLLRKIYPLHGAPVASPFCVIAPPRGRNVNVAIVPPKSGHSAKLLAQPTIYRVPVQLLTGKSKTTEGQPEKPTLFSVDFFLQSVTLNSAEDATADASGVQRISTPSIIAVWDSLRSDFCTCKISEHFVPLQSRIDGKNYSGNRRIPGTNTTNGVRNQPGAGGISGFNLFDLIFPVLQRPLGTAFDDGLSFPAGKLPRQYQVEGINFLTGHPAALLGDEMGLGKTMQVITACRVLFRQGKISSVCVICPKAVLTHWERQIQLWAPELKAITLEGTRDVRKILWRTGAHIYICTYETLRNDLETVIKQRGRLKNHFDLIVLDEVQKTKNKNAGLTKAVRSIKAEYRWAISGTPLENSIEDLVTICQTLKPDIFATLPYLSEASVKNAFQPIFKRRRARDVLDDLPEKVTNQKWLELSPSQREKYDLAEKAGIGELKGLGESATVQHVFALITRLKLICNLDPKNGKSVKLDYLKEKLEELTAEDHKALVFSQYPEKTLEKIKPKLEEFKPVIYDGQLSNARRVKMIDDFQSQDDNKIMLLSIKAGGAGIELQRANYVFHYDLWWNPATIAQATGRALRIGQKKVVFEYFLLTKGTIEERIFEITERKRLLFDNVIDDLSDEDAAKRALTTEELFGLFGLNSPKTSTPPTTSQNTASTLPSPSRLVSPSPPSSHSPPSRTNRDEFRNDVLWDNWWQQ